LILNLSRKTQREAQARALRHMSFNSYGASLSITSVVPLLALFYGAGDLVMGLIYAAIYVTGLAALFSPLFLDGAETTSVWRRAWFGRFLVGGAYLLLPLLPSSGWKIAGVLIIYYSFLTCASIGISACYVAQKAICPARTMQSFVARNTIRHVVSALPAMIVAFLVLDGNLMASEEAGFMLVLASAVTANFFAYYLLRKMPATGYLTEGTVAGLIQAFRIAFQTRNVRQVIVFTFLVTMLSISVMYQINYMKRVIEFSSATILFITALSMGGTLLAAVTLRIAGDHIPFRALMSSCQLVLIGVGICWIWVEAIPFAHTVAFVAVLYTLSAAALTVSGNVLHRLQTVRLPASHSYTVSVVYQIVTVVGAVVATIIVAVTAPLTRMQDSGLIHPYSNVFSLWVCMSAGICLMTILVRGERGLQFSKDLAALMPSNLVTIFRVHRAELQTTPGNRQLLMEGALMIPSRMSRAMMLKWAGSADTTERYRAYRLLNRQPLPEAFETVACEAASDTSPIRVEAITTLGYLGDRRAITLLQRILAAKDLSASAAAMKSLYRLGVDVPPQKMRDLFYGSASNATRLHVLTGLSSAAKRDELLALLRAEIPSRPDPYWLRSLFLHVLEAYGRRESMVEIFDAEQEKSGEGLNYILTEDDVPLLPDATRAKLRDLFQQEEYPRMSQCLDSAILGDLLSVAFDRVSALGLLFLWTVIEEERRASDSS